MSYDEYLQMRQAANRRALLLEDLLHLVTESDPEVRRMLGIAVLGLATEGFAAYCADPALQAEFAARAEPVTMADPVWRRAMLSMRGKWAAMWEAIERLEGAISDWRTCPGPCAQGGGISTGSAHCWRTDDVGNVHSARLTVLGDSSSILAFCPAHRPRESP